MQKKLYGPHSLKYLSLASSSLVAQIAKNVPTKQETRVRSLGQEDPLEKEMATHSSIIACRILWTEETGSYSPWGRKESDMSEWLTLSQPLPEEDSLPWLKAKRTIPFLFLVTGLGKRAYDQ